MLLNSGRLNYWYLAYLSKPAHHRPLYRAIEALRPRKILEFGVGSGQRAQRMIGLAATYRPDEPIEYVGVDLFEQRNDAADRLTLREAFCLLRGPDTRLRLLPGRPLDAFAPKANELSGIELVIVSADQDPASLTQAWFYLPRTLAKNAHVYIEERAGEVECYRLLSPADLAHLSAPRGRRRAA